jgi:anthranilate phosphoribosyltransferase
MLSNTQLAAPPLRHPVVDQGPVPNPLPLLLSGNDLTSDESEHLFERLVLGKLEPA